MEFPDADHAPEPYHHQILVNFNQPETPPSVKLDSENDTVTWFFVGLQPDTLPKIAFFTAPGEVDTNPDGPFSSLGLSDYDPQVGIPYKIVGTGNNLQNGPYHYEILEIHPVTGDVLRRIEGVEDPHIDNQGGPPNTEPDTGSGTE